jgi:hypothetical protein
MPWKECHVMDERLRFVARLIEGEKMAQLCAEFGISRKTCDPQKLSTARIFDIPADSAVLLGLSGLSLAERKACNGSASVSNTRLQSFESQTWILRVAFVVVKAELVDPRA